MEPLFFKAENVVSPETGFRRKRKASMEPLFFKAENREPPQRRDGARVSASMEPLFFKAENIGAFKAGKIRALTLQWSRFFSKRKI